MKINVVTLCSGYGAQEMALDRLKRNYPDFDWELLAWAEIEPNAIKAHQACHPEYADLNLGDITICDYSKITQPVDLLVYSTPCQSVSVAGQNKGMKEGSDAASALIWHTRRAIETLKPKVCILENVKGMIMGKNVKDFHKWQHVMESYGYTNYAKVLNSKDFGIPQNRERIFMVSIWGGQSYHFPEPFKLEKRIKDILEPYGTVDESFYFKPEQLLRIIAHCDRKVEEGCGFKTQFHTEDEVSGCVTAKYGQRETDPCIKESALLNPMPDGTARTIKTQYAKNGIANFMRDDGFGATGVQEPCGIKEGISIHPLNRKMEFQGFKSIQSDTEPCLTAHDGRGGEPVLWQRLSLYGNNAQAGRVYDVEGIAPCLDTCCGGNRMPKIPTPVRTEEAKELRRKGIEVFKHRELVPREDGICNTITTVTKDYLLQEPCILGYTRDDNGKVCDRHDKEIANTVHTSTGNGGNTDQFVKEPIAVAMRGRNPDNPSDRAKGAPTEQRLEFGDNIANCITTVQKDSMVAEPMVSKDPRKAFGVEDYSDICPTLVATDYKSPKIVREPMELSFNNLLDKTVLKDEDGKGYLWQDGGLWRVRKLVPIEVFRLQDVSDDDAKKIIAVCSKSVCYQLAGNSITCAVLYHIFRKLWIDTENESAQKSLFDF